MPVSKKFKKEAGGKAWKEAVFSVEREPGGGGIRSLRRFFEIKGLEFYLTWQIGQ